MLRNLFDTLRLKLAVHDHNRRHRRRVLKVMPSRAELDAIEAFRNLGAQTKFPERLGQAAQLEAYGVPDNLVATLCNITARGRLNLDHIHGLRNEGIQINTVPTLDRTVRLAEAVKRLAFIAGPGFTTDHLINEGIVKQGDL